MKFDLPLNKETKLTQFDINLLSSRHHISPCWMFVAGRLFWRLLINYEISTIEKPNIIYL